MIICMQRIISYNDRIKIPINIKILRIILFKQKILQFHFIQAQPVNNNKIY